MGSHLVHMNEYFSALFRSHTSRFFIVYICAQFVSYNSSFDYFEFITIVFFYSLKLHFCHFFCISEKRYNPQNEKDAEELLLENLSDSDNDLSDDVKGGIESEYAISRVEVRVGAHKIGP